MTAAYRTTIPARLRSLTAQIAQEYRDGASKATLRYKYATHSTAISAALVHEGVELRPRVVRDLRPSRYLEQHDGDMATRALPCKRQPCPHGVQAVCAMAGDPLADCDGCRFGRTVEGRVSVASSFGREFSVHGGIR